MTLDKKAYERYLKTFDWYQKRDSAIQRAGRRCQRCGSHNPRLEVHHVTYERLFKEMPDDLRVLCPPCHEQEDVERAARGRAKASNALYSARLDGWANKAYGECWEDYGYEEVLAHFDEWLEMQDDGY